MVEHKNFGLFYRLVLASMLFVALVSFSLAEEAPIWRAEVTPVCNGVCVEGALGNWQVQIQNVGKSSITLQQLGLIDSEGYTFASIDLSTQTSVIPPGETGTITLAGIIPPPSRSSTLYYKAFYGVGGNVFPDNSFRRMNVMPQSDIECTSNEFCSDGDICFGYRCTPYSLFNSSVVPKPSTDTNHEQIQTWLLGGISLLLLITLVAVLVGRSSPNKQK